MRALVLSAGYGTRLGDLTRATPKGMLPVASRPILEHIVRRLAAHGFDEVTLNLHFGADQIRAYFGDGAAFGARVRYWDEPVLLGTAGTLVALREVLSSGGPFLVHYGDVLTDEDLTAMRAWHEERAALLTLLVHERPGSNSIVVLDDERRIVDFVERPPADHPARRRSSWANSGICICDPSLFDVVSPEASDLARDVLAPLAGRPDVYAYPLSAFRVAVDSPERYAEAERVLAAGCSKMP